MDIHDLMSVIDPSNAPPVQVICLRINGADYHFFGPVVLPDDAPADSLNIEEIGFKGITTMSHVLGLLVAAIVEENDLRKSMQ
jgi:hypothetical protein